MVTQRTEPLAAGVDQMPRGYVEDLVLGANSSPQADLDLVQSSPDRTLQIGVIEDDADGGWTHPGNTVCKCAALFARSRIGCGNRPSQIVTAAAEGERDGGQRRRNRDRRAVLRRLGEEHQHDDAQIEERGDRRGEQSDDHQRGGVVIGRSEHVELADETRPSAECRPSTTAGSSSGVPRADPCDPARPTATAASPHRRRRGRA